MYGGGVKQPLQNANSRSLTAIPQKQRDGFGMTTKNTLRGGVVDLGALEAVGVVHVDRFPFGVKIDGGEAGFAMAVAGLLGASERKVRFGADSWRVDVDDARVDVALGAERVVDVARVD